jgi:hypothetical protein
VESAAVGVGSQQAVVCEGLWSWREMAKLGLLTAGLLAASSVVEAAGSNVHVLVGE